MALWTQIDQTIYLQIICLSYHVCACTNGLYSSNPVTHICMGYKCYNDKCTSQQLKTQLWVHDRYWNNSHSPHHTWIHITLWSQAHVIVLGHSQYPYNCVYASASCHRDTLHKEYVCTIYLMTCPLML